MFYRFLQAVIVFPSILMAWAFVEHFLSLPDRSAFLWAASLTVLVLTTWLAVGGVLMMEQFRRGGKAGE